MKKWIPGVKDSRVQGFTKLFILQPGHRVPSTLIIMVLAEEPFPYEQDTKMIGGKRLFFKL